MRSGVVDPGSGKFWHAGQAGYWWSSRAYYLYLHAINVYASGGPDNLYPGIPLRCLSTVLDM